MHTDTYARARACARAQDELLPAEVPAFKALIAASHVRAEELGEAYVWNIASVRSLCEMVRRCPQSMDELRLCWGFGGKGVRAQRHGDFLLTALAPLVAELRAAREQAAHGTAAHGTDDAATKEEEADTAAADDAHEGHSLVPRGGSELGEASDAEQRGSVPPRRPKAVPESRQTRAAGKRKARA
jgi:hypothetical protein